jgi:hypothetical protein
MNDHYIEIIEHNKDGSIKNKYKFKVFINDLMSDNQVIKLKDQPNKLYMNLKTYKNFSSEVLKQLR